MTNESHPPIRSGFVAIAGRPNVGKSTLMNRVLGASVSIVTPKAQTTRERVLGILTEPELGQIVFVDTPGVHRAREGGINAYMMQEAKEALDAPSLVWYLVDPSSKPEFERIVLELIARARAPMLMVLNKSDWIPAEALGAELEKLARELGIDVRGIFPISALRGHGVEPLLEATWKLLPEGPLYYPDPDQLSDRPLRFFAAEKVREQLLKQLGDELPYSCAVEIERFEEDSKPLRIEAVIHVERDSQKGMVIGKGGQKIKSIGQAARQEIETFIGAPAFLGLKVKVLKDWSRDSRALKRLGYVFNERKKPA